jgi:hypothetical protein
MPITNISHKTMLETNAQPVYITVKHPNIRIINKLLRVNISYIAHNIKIMYVYLHYLAIL